MPYTYCSFNHSNKPRIASRSGSAAPASARVDDLDLLDEYSIRRYLDEAKEQLDVIDFRRSR